MRLRARLGRLGRPVGRPSACAAGAGRTGLLVLTTARRLPDGTIVPQGDQPAPCAACGKVPEQIIEVIETVVDSAGNPI